MVLAVDDTQPLFMVQNTPTVSSVGNVLPVMFAGSSSTTGYGFDDDFPALPAPPATINSPLMLFGGASNAVLMNVASGVLAVGNYAGGPCLEPNCGANAIALTPRTSSVDFFASNLNFGSVALPARLSQYHIQPVNILGQNIPPFVSANLMRSTVIPNNLPLNGGYPFTVVNSAILVENVVDMQVEFGFDPTGNGLLRYVSSGGTQSITAAGPAPYNADTLSTGQQLRRSRRGRRGSSTRGSAFPNNGINGLNVIQQLR